MATDANAPDDTAPRDAQASASSGHRVKKWTFSPRGIVASGAALAALILALCGIALWQGRADAINRGRDTSTNLITVVNRDIARNVEIYGLSLRAVVDGVQTPAVMAMPIAMRDKVLFDRAMSAPFIGDVVVTDEAGRVLIAHGKDAPPVNIAQRDFFIAQANSVDAGLYVSHPFHNGAQDDDWRVAMSRRIDRPDGSFGGVALLTVRLEYFERLLSHLDLGDKGSATLMQADGTLMARQPYDPRQIGRLLAPAAHNATLVSENRGSFMARSAVDGVNRLFTFERVPGTSMIALVGLSSETLLTGWRHRSLLLGGAILGLSAVLMLAAFWFARALRASLAAQSHLEQLASIDGLTGLLNRRAFDEHVSREWKRSVRSGRPLALLMLDVDYFKAFNDRYGHGRGDLALIAVAGAIKSALRRPGDIAARFGGEEFVIVLADTDLDGACRVADAVRRAVTRLHIPHAASDHRALTVSIGVAERTQRQDDDSVDKLIRRADTALYEAKGQGRNTVCSSSAEETAGSALSVSIRPFAATLETVIETALDTLSLDAHGRALSC